MLEYLGIKIVPNIYGLYKIITYGIINMVLE